MQKMLSRLIASFICTVMMFTTFGFDLFASTKILTSTESDYHVHSACADEACIEQGISESGLLSILGIESIMNSGLDGSDINIAIFDTGIIDNKCEVSGGISFIGDTTISNDHGTRMAETLTAIAPEANLYDVRILDDNGEGKYSDIARGIDWAIKNDIQIIALSIEGFENSDVLAEALDKAEGNNILVIAAAGNQGSNEVAYPAAYPQVISVGALNASGEIASYSNYGDQVDVYAPGVGIGDFCEPGTSYSVQYITGVAALLWDADATLSGAEIRNLITGSVSDGRLNAAQAYTNLTLGDFSTDVSGKANITGSDLDGIVYAAACSHNYVYVSTTSPTCTAQGYSTYRCYKCGATQKRNYVAAKGHSYYNVTTPATCTNAATYTTKCSRCSYSNTVTTSGALGHSYTVLLSTTPKTCTTQGYSTYRCSRCSATQVRDYVAAGHNYYTVCATATCTNAATCTTKCYGCSYSNTVVTSGALGHSYTVLVSTTPKTCTTQGYSTYRCSRCSSTINTNYVAAGHDTYTVVVDSTCTNTGSSTLKCKACSYSNTYATIPATGHNYTVLDSTTPKTCTTQGYSTYRCSRCSSTINTNYVAAGHDTYTVVVDPTCTNTGSSTLACKACSYANTYVTIPALGHSYGDWVVTQDPAGTTKIRTCSRCGNIDTSYQITYLANGGTFDSGTLTGTKYYGVPYSITTIKPTRTGYKFLGWSQSMSAITPAYVGGDQYTTNAPANFHAVWQNETFSISLNANGGVLSETNIACNYGTKVEMLPTPTKTGFIFSGWCIYDAQTGAIGTQLSPSYVITTGLSLIAIYKSVGVQIDVPQYLQLLNDYGSKTITITGSPNTTYRLEVIITTPIAEPEIEDWIWIHHGEEFVDPKTNFTTIDLKTDNQGKVQVTLEWGGITVDYDRTAELKVSTTTETPQQSWSFPLKQESGYLGRMFNKIFTNATIVKATYDKAVEDSVNNNGSIQVIDGTAKGSLMPVKVYVKAVDMTPISVKLQYAIVELSYGDESAMIKLLDSNGLTITEARVEVATEKSNQLVITNFSQSYCNNRCEGTKQVINSVLNIAVSWIPYASKLGEDWEDVTKIIDTTKDVFNTATDTINIINVFTTKAGDTSGTGTTFLFTGLQYNPNVITEADAVGWCKDESTGEIVYCMSYGAEDIRIGLNQAIFVSAAGSPDKVMLLTNAGISKGVTAEIGYLAALETADDYLKIDYKHEYVKQNINVNGESTEIKVQFSEDKTINFNYSFTVLASDNTSLQVNQPEYIYVS